MCVLAYARTWVVPSDGAPEQSGWERALRTEDFLLADDRISGPSNQRLALYALLQAADMAKMGWALHSATRPGRW